MYFNKYFDLLSLQQPQIFRDKIKLSKQAKTANPIKICEFDFLMMKT